ncbi:unnamed protein product, partial [Allacma fusca]
MKEETFVGLFPSAFEIAEAVFSENASWLNDSAKRKELLKTECERTFNEKWVNINKDKRDAWVQFILSLSIASVALVAQGVTVPVAMATGASVGTAALIATATAKIAQDFVSAAAAAFDVERTPASSESNAKKNQKNPSDWHVFCIAKTYRLVHRVTRK